MQPKQDDSAAKVISQLQEHLKQLREENLGLHQQLAARQAPHGSSASMSDLLAATASPPHTQPLGGSLPVSAKVHVHCSQTTITALKYVQITMIENSYCSLHEWNSTLAYEY